MDDEVVDFKALYELSKAKFEELETGFTQFKEAQKAEIDGLKTEFNRPPIVPETKDKVSPEMKAFGEWLRKDLEGVSDKKALYRSDLQTGGILAPKEWVNEMLRDVTEYSPMRQLVRVRPTSRVSVQVPVYTGTGSATWVHEKGSKTETMSPAWGLEEVTTHETYALVDISQQDIEDADFPLEQFMQQEMALQFAIQEAAVILSGDGIGKPFGIFDASQGVATLETAGSHALASDDIMELYFKLKPAYLGNARFMMNRMIEKVVFELKDSDLHYLWQPDYQAGLGAIPLLGKPVVEAPEMADDLLTDADKIIIFGDFNQAYWLIDRVATQVIRDPLTKAADGLIRYIARRRIGGRVVKPEALKIMTVKA